MIAVDQQLVQCLSILGAYNRLDESIRLAALESDLQMIFKIREGAKTMLNKQEFVKFCLAVIGQAVPVVVKFMMNKVRRETAEESELVSWTNKY